MSDSTATPKKLNGLLFEFIKTKMDAKTALKVLNDLLVLEWDNLSKEDKKLLVETIVNIKETIQC